MAISRHRGARLDFSCILLAALLAILWFAGGASREDVMGQVLSRVACWTAIVIAIVFARRPRIADARGVALILGFAVLLCVAQLVPLPSNMWHALPGRDLLIDPMVVAPDLSRPWSLLPGASVNALSSLVVPLAILVVVTSVREENRRWILVAVLAVIALALLVGLVQVTGVQLVNPLVNGTPGAVDGLIANRNHFALFLAIGLLIAPVWGIRRGNASRVTAPVAFGFILLIVLAILASGSRAGMVLGVIALALGLTMSRSGIKSALRRYPRWTLPALGIGIVALIAIFVLASVAAGRAVSIDRLFADDPGIDMRSRGLPSVLAMIRTYFPFGTGMGSFDPVFRMHEPFELLKPTHFNHAHNDVLEVLLNAGLPGLLLLVAALGWWIWRSVAAWRGDAVLPKLGSATLLLILLASIIDYPARTPIIMAMATIAAVWLDGVRSRGGVADEAPLPSTGRKL